MWTRYYRDALGVNLITDWTCTNTEYNDKLNIVIASSDIPDLVIECSYNQLQTMAEADMLMAVSYTHLDVYKRQPQALLTFRTGREMFTSVFACPDGRMPDISLTPGGFSAAVDIHQPASELLRQCQVAFLTAKFLDLPVP